MSVDLRSQSSLDDDADYRAFIDDISVTQEELSVLIEVPEVQSIQQARDYVRKTKTTPHVSWDVAREIRRFAAQVRHLMTAVSLVMVGLRHGRNHRQT